MKGKLFFLEYWKLKKKSFLSILTGKNEKFGSIISIFGEVCAKLTPNQPSLWTIFLFQTLFPKKMLETVIIIKSVQNKLKNIALILSACNNAIVDDIKKGNY